MSTRSSSSRLRSLRTTEHYWLQTTDDVNPRSSEVQVRQNLYYASYCYVFGLVGDIYMIILQVLAQDTKSLTVEGYGMDLGDRWGEWFLLHLLWGNGEWHARVF